MWVKLFCGLSQNFFGMFKIVREASLIFYSCLEFSLKVDYLKTAWKLEALSENYRKTQKAFIRQNLFSHIVFIENKRALYQSNEK